MVIERKFVEQNIKEFEINEYIKEKIKKVGLSKTRLIRTPVGEKIVVYAARPGLIVGKKGQNIKELTIVLKEKFGLENPQIEISEIENVNLDATVVAEKIAIALERFGPQRFKAVGYKTMVEVMNAGARGVEILISGKIPSSRAKTWRFYQGYLKKSGDIAANYVEIGYTQAKLKSGVVGIKVSILPRSVILPDDIQFKAFEEEVQEVNPVKEIKEETSKEPKVKKKTIKKKKVAKKEEVKENE